MLVIMRMIMMMAVTMMMVVTLMMIVIMMMIMGMIMTAPAPRAMGVMRLMRMIMTMMLMTLLTMSVIVIRTPLRLEGARHRGHCTPQTTDHFSQDMILFDIDRIRRDLRGCVAIADMPSGFQKPHRILGLDLDQCLRRRLDQNE
mgnify:CR=1 FL=1